MKYRRFGKTEWNVSVETFGAWAIVGGFNWGPQDMSDSRAALRAAYDAGINFFDTAEMYGDGKSEELIGETLGDVRNKIFIASKVLPENLSSDKLIKACERSLRRLKTDYLDLYQIHWPNRSVAFDESVEALEQLKAAGKIREYGVSNFGKQDLTDIFEVTGAIVSNQMAYNMLFRAIEFGILPFCYEKQIAVMTYSSIMQGLLTGKFTSPDDVPPDRARTRHFAGSRPEAIHNEPGHELLTFETIAAIQRIADDIGRPVSDIALAWLMAQPGVTTVIVSGRNAHQTWQNARAADLELDASVLRELNAATDALKQAMGPNPDMWRSESRIR